MRQNSAKIDYDDLPGTARALRIPDKLILDDCFNLDLVKHFVENESGIKELTGVAPFKIKFPYIIFCKSGEGVFKVNMVEVPLKASQIMICPEGTIIDDIKLNMDTKIGFIAFSTEVFVSGISSECIAVLRRNIISPKVLDVDDKRLSLVLTTYGSMRSIMSMDHFSFKEDALKGCTTILLSMLSQWLYSQEKSSSIAKSRDETLFLNFLGEIRVNCSKERKVSYYAEKFHISPSILPHLFTMPADAMRRSG